MQANDTFDRRLIALFQSDAALAIPAETTVRGVIDDRCNRRRNPRGRLLVLAAGVAALALAIFSITPARALVPQLLPFGWVQRFGAVLIGPTPSPTPHRSASGKAPTASQPQAMPHLTFEQAQQLAGFRIPQPSYLPPGITFRFAFATLDHSTVGLSYGRADRPSGGVGLQIEQGSPVGGYMFPASAATTVKVRGRDAVYVQGSWDEHGQWQANADSAFLSWQAGGFTYNLQYSGLGLTRAEMIRIAESVQ